MRIRRALIGFLALTALYVGLLAWLDAQRHVFQGLLTLAPVMPVLAAVSMGTYLARYARWRWLLARAGHAMPWWRGFLAYLAGFAFTATPGKVGELIRIRYLVPLGVPAWRVAAAFIFERAMDLLVVLGLSMFFIRDLGLLALAGTFVLICVSLVVVLGRQRALTGRLSQWLRGIGLHRLAQAAAVLADGLAACGDWLRLKDLSVSAALGLVAWGGTSLGFVYLIRQLGVTTLPMAEALAIYPLSMLAGAASMLPGGIGSTEATLAALLASLGVAATTGVLAAVGIRIATLWFAILCGLASVAMLEAGAASGPVRTDA